MRVVGLLLISALMIVPVAIAQLVCRSFRSSAASVAVIGVVVATSVVGVAASFYADTPSGGTIVLLAVGVFVVVGAGCVGGPGAHCARAGTTAAAERTTCTSTGPAAGTRSSRTRTTSTTCTTGTGTRCTARHYDEH